MSSCHEANTYMRNLPGWLKTRLAQNTLTYIKLVLITFKHKKLKLGLGDLRSFEPA